MEIRLAQCLAKKFSVDEEEEAAAALEEEEKEDERIANAERWALDDRKKETSQEWQAAASNGPWMWLHGIRSSLEKVQHFFFPCAAATQERFVDLNDEHKAVYHMIPQQPSDPKQSSVDAPRV